MTTFGNYVVDMFHDYFRRTWKWSLVITALLVIIKLWRLPYLGIATVTVCLWGPFIIVPMVALITYQKKRPLHERFSEKLKAEKITPTVKDVEDVHIVSYMKGKTKVSVVFGSDISTYVMKKIKTDGEKRKKLNSETSADIGYYDESGVAVQKHVFMSKSLNDIYKTHKEDIKRAEKAFKEIV